MRLPTTVLAFVPFLLPACVDTVDDAGGVPIVDHDRVVKGDIDLPVSGTAHIWTPHGVLEVAYHRDGDRVVFQDDMTVPVADFVAAMVTAEDLAAIEAGEPILHRAAVRAAGRYRWPGGVVPFAWGVGLTDAQRVAAQQAMDHWEANTSIDFVERINNENDYFEFRAGDVTLNWCRADVGRLGGLQEVRINGCGRGGLIHELGHTVGFYHEHARYDRDTYVTINWANVDPDRVTDFQRYVERIDGQTGEERDGTDAGPYDYGSIMHYGTHSASINGQPTITPKQSGVVIGQRNGLSTGDILAANQLVYPGGIANDKVKIALYANSGYGGASVALGKGYHSWQEFGAIGDNNVSSMIIPKGLAVHAWSGGVDDPKKIFGVNTSTMPSGWDNTISAVIVSRAVRVYRDANQTGIAQGFTTGTWKANAGHFDIIGNDTISSIYVPPGLLAELCVSEDGATCQTFEGGVNSLGTFDNKTSMIRVKAAVTVYQEGNLWGTQKSFPIGTYNGSFAPVAPNSISSLIVGDGLKATLCDYTDGTGNCAVFRGDVNFIGGALNDRVSYIKVEPNTAP